jgi:hypothetical protein
MGMLKLIICSLVKPMQKLKLVKLHHVTLL